MSNLNNKKFSYIKDKKVYNAKVYLLNLKMAKKIEKIEEIVQNIEIETDKKLLELESLKKEIRESEDEIETVFQEHDISKVDFEDRWHSLTWRLSILETTNSKILLNKDLNRSYTLNVYNKITEFVDIYEELLDKYASDDSFWNIIEELDHINNWKKWETDDTYNNIKNMIIEKAKKFIKLEQFEVEFINHNLEDYLVLDENIVNLTLSINKIRKNMRLKIIVKIEGEYTKFKKIAKLFQKPMNWSLDDNNTYSEVLNLIRKEIENNNFLISQIQLIDNIEKKKLEIGKNKLVKVKITLIKNSYDLSVIIANIASRLEHFDFSQLNKEVIKVDTSSKYSDLLKIIIKRVRALSELLTVHLIENNPEDYLTHQINIVKVYIVFNKEFQLFEFNVSVKFSSEHLAKEVKIFLNQEFEFSLLSENFKNEELIKEINLKLESIFVKDYDRIVIDSNFSQQISSNDRGEYEWLLKITVDKKISLEQKLHFRISFSINELLRRVVTFLKNNVFDFNLKRDNTVADFFVKLKAELKNHFHENVWDKIGFWREHEQTLLGDGNKIITIHGSGVKIKGIHDIDDPGEWTDMQVKITYSTAELKQALSEYLDKTFDFNFNEKNRLTDLSNHLKRDLQNEFTAEILKRINFSWNDEIVSVFSSLNQSTHNLKIEIDKSEYLIVPIKVKVDISNIGTQSLITELKQYFIQTFDFQLDEKSKISDFYQSLKIKISDDFNEKISRRIKFQSEDDNHLLAEDMKAEKYHIAKVIVDENYIFEVILKMKISISSKFITEKLKNLFENKTFDFFNLRYFDTIAQFLKKLKEWLTFEWSQNIVNRLMFNREGETTILAQENKNQTLHGFHIKIDNDQAEIFVTAKVDLGNVTDTVRTEVKKRFLDPNGTLTMDYIFNQDNYTSPGGPTYGQCIYAIDYELNKITTGLKSKLKDTSKVYDWMDPKYQNFVIYVIWYEYAILQIELETNKVGKILSE